MKYIIKILIVFALTDINAQIEIKNNDFQLEPFTITEQTILDLLLSYKNEFDSIQYLEVYQGFRNPKKSGGYGSKPIFPIDSSKIKRVVRQLISWQPKGDTIIFTHRETLIYSVYPNSENNYSFTSEYVINTTRKGNVKNIETSFVKAKFKYDLFKKLKGIKFIYKTKDQKYFDEGTLSHIRFNYQKGRLYYVDLIGFYGDNVTIVKYY